MDVYLVGGAVRDEILNLPVKDKDWLVVGATPEKLIENGYLQVGKDFPVFLHPKTKEEYALARTERKVGAGYYGFCCDFSPTVTLEEDLLRRDLTINAIAKDKHGKIIDPYGGVNDIKNKVLRHVSAAFVEDPLRVLRVLRFYARFAEFGFSIAPATFALCQEIVNAGELKNLTRERVLLECLKALQSKAPDKFFQGLWDLQTLDILGFSCNEVEIVTLNSELIKSVERTTNVEQRLAMWLHLATEKQRQGFLSQLPVSVEIKYWINLVSKYGEAVNHWRSALPELRWEVLKAAKSLRERGNIFMLMDLMDVIADVRADFEIVHQKLIDLDPQKIIAQCKTPAEIGVGIQLAQQDLLR